MEQNSNNEQVAEMLQDPQMLVGLFENTVDAERAYNYLIKKGHEKKNINLIMSEATSKKYSLNTPQGTNNESEAIMSAEKGTAIGGSIGVTIGAIAGIALAIGSNVIIPGLGFLIAGPLFAGLAGAGTGGIAGGLIGALIGVGFEEDRAQLYETLLKNGQILIGVHVNKENEETIKLAWKTMGATEISK